MSKNFETIALLLSDGYKQVHAEQYPKGLTKLYSYFTPRRNRIPELDTMMFFGLQGFIKKYLIDYFKANFFDIDEDIVMTEYTRVVDTMLGHGNYNPEKVRALHRLGYLPLEIRALPEGSKVNMGVPCIEITNTHDDFAWVVQWVESLISSEIWKPCAHATIAKMYRNVVDRWYDKTVDDNIPHHKAISDFGFRGMSCLQEAEKASSAWLTCFSGTATIPAVKYIEDYYGMRNDVDHFATNAISTEHSVMCCNAAIDGDERTMVKRLLTEIYPHASFSMVSDSYDYWNLVDNILPTLKDEIMAHDGKLLIRPDSGDIVEISVKTIEHLWDIFGGTINSKGYKVLDPHIGCVYGDSVTMNRANTIYEELEKRGFASNNIVFGAGSFSFTCYQDANGGLQPLTRDTWSCAIKSTGGILNGKFVPIFKNPKTDRESGFSFKKSQRGCCNVWYNKQTGLFEFIDGIDPTKYTVDEWHKTYPSDYVLYFKYGEMVNEQTLTDIRNRIMNNKF